MSIAIWLIAAVLLVALGGFYSGRSRVRTQAAGNLRSMHSLPSYYGAYVALWCVLPALLLVVIGSILIPLYAEFSALSSLPASTAQLSEGRMSLLLNDIRNLADGNIVSRAADEVVQAAAEKYQAATALGHWVMIALAMTAAAGGLFWGRARIAPRLRARNDVERILTILLVVCSTIAIFTTIGIILSLLFESIRFFGKVPFFDFLFGLEWSPQTALRKDQVGSSGAFGAIPLFVGTLLITLIAMVVAVPIGLFSAIYLSDYAGPRARAIIKPVLEILAGIPTVVYGYFAALTIAPNIRGLGEALGLDVASESALAAGLVMGVMIIPFISSLSDDVMNAVPQNLREGSFALGATMSETIRQVVLPAALPGIFASVLLAVSRAIGETMIVVMAAGLAANLTANPLEAVTTVTVQIVTLLVGDQEFDSAKTLAAFALGLTLFCATLAMNIIALRMVRKYSEQYE